MRHYVTTPNYSDWAFIAYDADLERGYNIEKAIESIARAYDEGLYWMDRATEFEGTIRDDYEMQSDICFDKYESRIERFTRRIVQVDDHETHIEYEKLEDMVTDYRTWRSHEIAE